MMNLKQLGASKSLPAAMSKHPATKHGKAIGQILAPPGTPDSGTPDSGTGGSAAFGGKGGAAIKK